jgi:AcrR family transcriptional regulator
MSRPGRRPGNPDTKDTILSAARTLFATNGFKGTSIRQIAAAAEVDPALVHHYFASKDQLFLATVKIPLDLRSTLSSVLAANPADFGPNLVRTLLGVWSSEVGPSMVAAFRAALADPESSRMVQEFVGTTVLGTVSAAMHLAPNEAPRRTALIASQMLGIIVGRYLLLLEPLASMSAEDLISSAGRTVQHYLTGPLDAPQGRSSAPGNP